MSEPPAPLVPPNVDLSGYEFMPYYGDRLRDSDLNGRATDAEYRAAHNLWWAAWKQVPAASLPDDDVILCKLADLGRDFKTWRLVKERALHGFVKCSDGRHYHRVLAPLALDAWTHRLNASAKGKIGASKRWGKHRHPEPMAQASKIDSTGNAPATKKHSKGEERIKDLGGEVTSPTRGKQLQKHLKNFGKSTPSADIDRNLELARLAVEGKLPVGGAKT